MALDRTVGHWYVEEQSKTAPTPAPTQEASPGFNAIDVVLSTMEQVRDIKFPSGTGAFMCVDAEYRSGNEMWVVTCEYYKNPGDGEPEVTITYLFDDNTGRVVD